ncbi:MAG: biotin synthase BioB [Pseudomonadota bacterium]
MTCQPSTSHDIEGTARHDWREEEVRSLFALPFTALIWRAQGIHRAHHPADKIQLSQLISVKTGGCREDCGYCAQSAKYAATTGLKASKLMAVDAVVADAAQAKARGATRYCMGAAWSRPKARDLTQVCAMVRAVKALGLETCATLGMLDEAQAHSLAAAGLDYYNHNIDTSEDFYPSVVTTRRFAERLETLAAVRAAGIAVCCGGIIGLGESREDRAAMLTTLANLDPHPESVPINQLIAIPGTPLASAPPVDPFEFVRTIAVARIIMPASLVRLSAGRSAMSDELHALCFVAGANSIFISGKLLTADNPALAQDMALLQRLGLTPLSPENNHSSRQMTGP